MLISGVLKLTGNSSNSSEQDLSLLETISKSLAEAHGGKLWFESEEGKGTTFYVKLPIQSELLEVTV